MIILANTPRQALIAVAHELNRRRCEYYEIYQKKPKGWFDRNKWQRRQALEKAAEMSNLIMMLSQITIHRMPRDHDRDDFTIQRL